MGLNNRLEPQNDAGRIVLVRDDDDLLFFRWMKLNPPSIEEEFSLFDGDAEFHKLKQVCVCVCVVDRRRSCCRGLRVNACVRVGCWSRLFAQVPLDGSPHVLLDAREV